MAYKFNPFTGTFDEKLDVGSNIKENIALNDNYISNDGGNEGVLIQDDGSSNFVSASTGALSFTGATHHLNCGEIIEFPLGSAFTISLWHYNTTDSTEQILWKYYVSSTQYIELKLTSSRQIRLNWVSTGENGYGSSVPAGFLVSTNLYTSDVVGDLNAWNHWTVVYDGTETAEHSVIGVNSIPFYFNQVSDSDTTDANGRIFFASNNEYNPGSNWHVGDIINISGTTNNGSGANNDGTYTITEIVDITSPGDHLIVSSDGGTTPHVFTNKGVDSNSENILLASEPKKVKIYKNGTLLSGSNGNNLVWSAHDAIDVSYNNILDFSSTSVVERSSGSFIDDGFQPGMRISISGASHSDNNNIFVLKNVLAGSLTVANSGSYSFIRSFNASGSDSNNVRIQCNTFREKHVASYAQTAGLSIGFADKFPPALSTGASTFYIGYTSNSLRGLVGEVAIWNTYLTSTEVLEIYDNGHAYDAINIQKHNLVTYWKMSALNSNIVSNSVPWRSTDYPATAVNGPSLSSGMKGSSYRNAADSVKILRVPLNVNNNYISDNEGILLESQTADGSGGVYVSPDGKVSLMDISSAWVTSTIKDQLQVLHTGHISAFETDNWSVSQWVNHTENADDTSWYVKATNTGAECNANFIKFYTTGTSIEFEMRDNITASSLHSHTKPVLIETPDFKRPQTPATGYAQNRWYHYLTVFDMSKKVTTGDLVNKITVNASTRVITRSDGNFVTDGFVVGMMIHIALPDLGTVSQVIHKIEAVDALTITVTSVEAGGPGLTTDATANETVKISSVGLECLTIYRNGVKVEMNMSMTSTGMSNTSPIEHAIPLTHSGSADSVFVLGGTSGVFAGAIGETAVWRTSLTSAQAVTLYANGYPYAANAVDASNLMGYWKMKGQWTPVDSDGEPNPSDGSGYTDVAYNTWTIPLVVGSSASAEVFTNSAFYGGKGHRVQNSFGEDGLDMYVASTNHTAQGSYKYIYGLSCAATQMTVDGLEMLRGSLKLHGNQFVQDESTALQTMAAFNPNLGSGSSTTAQSLNVTQTIATASGKTSTNTGISTTLNSSTPTMIGTVNNIGAEITVIGGTSGTQNNTALSLQATGADTNTHIKCLYDATNYMTLATGANGATTLTTVDASSGTDANLTLDVAGDIEINADGGDITFKDNTTTLGSWDSSGNLLVKGDLIIDDGGSIKEAGGTAAITIDAAGEVSKIGQDTPSDGQVLTWDNGNSKVVWAAGGGSDTNTTYSVSCADGDNSDEEKIVLTAGGSGSGTDVVVLEAGTGLSIARSSDKITFTNTVTVPTFGIADTNAVKIDSGSVNDDEYARFTANGLEGRTGNEVISDLGLLPLSGGTMTGNVDFGDNDITNVDSLDADKFSIAGGTEMTGIGAAVSGNSSTNISTANRVKEYVDSNCFHFIRVGAYIATASNSFLFIAGAESQRDLTSITSASESFVFTAPYDGSLVKVMARSETACGSSDFNFYLRTSETGYEIPSTLSPTSSVTVDMGVDDTSYEFDFSSVTNAFSKGDIMVFSFDPTNTPYDSHFVIVLKFDTST